MTERDKPIVNGTKQQWLIHIAVIAAVSLLVAAVAIAEPAGAASDAQRSPQNQAQTTPLPYSAFLPIIMKPSSCPTTSTAQFNSIPVGGPPADHPDYLHGDLNLSLRGYEPTSAYLGLVDYGGDTDPNAVQLPGLFSDRRTPAFSGAYQVYNWDWGCGQHGCRGRLLTSPEVTLLGMATTRGEAIGIPSRDPEVYIGGFKTMVLYAEQQRITLTYTRGDTVAVGYAVHIENVCVDPNLLSLYRQLNAAGRGWLPALRNGETLGTAAGNEIRIAVRDNGTFMDPRSRKDWWQGR